MKKELEMQIPEVVRQVRKNKWKNLGKKIWEYRVIYLMMLPVVISYLIFSYIPMYGLLLSIKKYSASKGIIGSPFVDPWYKYFVQLFQTDGERVIRSIKNTLLISVLKITFCFPAPIIMGLLLNEVKFTGYKKLIQAFIYLPNFISWVIFGGIVMDICGNDGIISNIRHLMGLERKSFTHDPGWYYPILIFFSILKDTGWNTIIYMAAISAVSPTLYEAATMDGCGRFKLMWHVTIPCIGPIIIIQFLLAIGNIMNAGFDPIFNTYNKDVYDVADIIDTYMYRITFESSSLSGFSLGTAVGLMKAVINFVLLMLANFFVKKINGTGIYDLGD